MHNVMRTSLKIELTSISFILVQLVISSYAFATSLEDAQVLKISAQEERAIIKTPDGKMQIIKPGDMVGNDSKVMEITAGRVMFEEKMGNETETVIIRLEDGKQRVERIKKAAVKQPQLYGVKAPREQKVESKEPVKNKRKKDKKQKPANEIKKSSVIN